MNGDKKLTIAIPTYDREAFLREALKSISGQTFKDFKVILFDNASPYGIDKLAAEFTELQILIDKNETNIGNLGNFAKVMSHEYDTPYVMIFHDDDTIHPEYLQNAIAVLEKESEVMWVASHINYVRNDDEMMRFGIAPASPEVEVKDKPEMTRAFMQNVAIGFSSVIYRQEAVKLALPNKERFFKWLDRPYMLDASGDKKMALLKYPFINYRLHPSQDSAQSYRKNLEQMVNLIEYFCDITGRDKEALIFATSSAIKTAAVNATSVKDFFAILHLFQDRGLYNFKYVRPYAMMWLGWLLLKRFRYFLLKR